MKPDELTRSLQKGTVLPLYLFYGDEEYLIQEALDRITELVVDPSTRDFNSTTVYCKGATGGEIVNLAETLPFMAERRLVVAKEIEALRAGDLEALAAYLQSPSPSTCLVMTSRQPRFEKKAVTGPVEAKGAVVRFFPLLDREILPWIEAWAKARKLSIQRDAADYLWRTLGNDLQVLSGELQKAVIHVGDRKVITLDDVRTVAGDFREYTPFDLADAIGRRDREQALRVLARLIQEGEAPVGLLGSIGWNVRRVMHAKGMEEAGRSFEEIKKRHRIIFHQAAAFQQQLRSWNLRELQEAVAVLLRTDRLLKSSGMSGRLVLERMVLRLCP